MPVPLNFPASTVAKEGASIFLELPAIRKSCGKAAQLDVQEFQNGRENFCWSFRRGGSNKARLKP